MPPLASPHPALPDPTDASLDRERALADWLRAHAPVLIGFSGGVDSAYLASVAIEAVGADGVLAVIGRSASYPEAQWRSARAVADLCGVPVLEVDTHELDDPDYAANPTDRCYFCKRELWGRLAPLARVRDMQLIDGTNADDLDDWRPGARAGAEAAVRSPLAEVGLVKADIRLLSARRGLPTAHQPSAPCLASRLPYGTPVTAPRLAQVEAAECALRVLGVRGNLRVRHHGDTARIELAPAAIDEWTTGGRLPALRAAVAGAGFTHVVVDLRGFRSGSLNVLGGVVAG
ncbi:MAG: ATP-dependent sacrificial sulfur transferase LarE [Gemmatirosa sp.]